MDPSSTRSRSHPQEPIVQALSLPSGRCLALFHNLVLPCWRPIFECVHATREADKKKSHAETRTTVLRLATAPAIALNARFWPKLNTEASRGMTTAVSGTKTFSPPCQTALREYRRPGAHRQLRSQWCWDPTRLWIMLHSLGWKKVSVAFSAC